MLVYAWALLPELGHRSGKVRRELTYGTAVQPAVSPETQLVTIP
jgi:hypothetical protein